MFSELNAGINFLFLILADLDRKAGLSNRIVEKIMFMIGWNGKMKNWNLIRRKKLFSKKETERV